LVGASPRGLNLGVLALLHFDKDEVADEDRAVSTCWVALFSEFLKELILFFILMPLLLRT
jgi:hypothetical protein